MRRPQGYGVEFSPEGIVKEEDSFTCGHCNAVVFVAPLADPSSFGGFCRLCMRHVCEPCAGQGGCDPFEKKLERMESKGRSLRAILGR